MRRDRQYYCKDISFIKKRECGTISDKKVFVNGRLNENNSGQLNANDVVSVRGFGRFLFVGIMGETRKGKLNADIDMYC